MSEVLVQHDEDIPQIEVCENKKKSGFLFWRFSPLLGATNGEVRNFAVKTIVGAASLFFKFSRFAVEKKDSFFLV